MSVLSRPQPIFRSFVSLSAVGLMGLALVGCGGSTDPAMETAENTVPSHTAPLNQPQESTPSPKDVVSAFLDAIRRGGESASAAQGLLSDDAQQQLALLNSEFRPFSSPEASFEVTRYEEVPAEPGNALVHSVWKEPEVDPQQVVWAVKKQLDGWRITGMVLQVDPNTDPMAIDFENINDMAAILGVAVPGTESQPVSSEPPAGSEQPSQQTTTSNETFAKPGAKVAAKPQ